MKSYSNFFCLVLVLILLNFLLIPQIYDETLMFSFSYEIQKISEIENQESSDDILNKSELVFKKVRLVATSKIKATPPPAPEPRRQYFEVPVHAKDADPRLWFMTNEDRRKWEDDLFKKKMIIYQKNMVWYRKLLSEGKDPVLPPEVWVAGFKPTPWEYLALKQAIKAAITNRHGRAYIKYYDAMYPLQIEALRIKKIKEAESLKEYYYYKKIVLNVFIFFIFFICLFFVLRIIFFPLFLLKKINKLIKKISKFSSSRVAKSPSFTAPYEVCIAELKLLKTKNLYFVTKQDLLATVTVLHDFINILNEFNDAKLKTQSSFLKIRREVASFAVYANKVQFYSRFFIWLFNFSLNGFAKGFVKFIKPNRLIKVLNTIPFIKSKNFFKIDNEKSFNNVSHSEKTSKAASRAGFWDFFEY